MSAHREDVFIFVNRNPKQLELTGQQLSVIRSHASRVVNNRQRIERICRYSQAAPWNQVEEEQVASTGAALGVSLSQKVYPRKFDSRKSLRACFKTSRCQKELTRRKNQWRSHCRTQLTFSDDDEERSAIVRLDSRVSSDSLRRDPFGVLPAKASTEVYTAIDYYIQSIAPLYGSFVSPDGRGNGCLDVILPLSMHNLYLFHILIANSRVMQLADEGAAVVANDNAVIDHHGQALAALQGALHDVADDALPLGVVQLISLEWRLGDTHALSLNSQGLRQIMKARGKRAPTPASKIADIIIKATSSVSILKPNEQDDASYSTEQAAPAVHTTTASSQPQSLAPPRGPSTQPSSTHNSQSTDHLPSGFRPLTAIGAVSPSVLTTIIATEKLATASDIAGISHAHHEHLVHLNLPHTKPADRWLNWAVKAYLFQRSDRRYRMEPKAIESVNELVEEVVAYLENTHDHRAYERSDAMRHCQIWSLICVAGADNRRRRDAAIAAAATTTTTTTGPLDTPASISIRPGGAAATTVSNQALLEADKDKDKGARAILIYHVCRIVFGSQLPRMTDGEWIVLEVILARFLWCPPWLMREWEAMYRKVLVVWQWRMY